MRRFSQGSLADVYFIFADDVYEQKITLQTFKALINFYALLYDRIVIPDSFFINNRHLLKFLSEPSGIAYVNKGIIVPSVREEINSLFDIYFYFKQSNTLKEKWVSEKDLLNVIERVNLENSIRWNRTEIAHHFTENIQGNLEKLHIHPNDKQLWLQLMMERYGESHLTRKGLYSLTKSIEFNSHSSKEKIIRYIDLTYNFNIPHYLQLSAAYPVDLLKNVDSITPEQIFLNIRQSKKHMEAIADEQHLFSSFFNEYILASLDFEQVHHLRSLKEHKKLKKHLRNGNDHEEKLKDLLFDFIDQYDKELPRIVSRDIKERIKKEQRKLTIQQFGTDILSGEGVSVGSSGLATMIGISVSEIANMAGGRLIGHLINIALSPWTSKTKRNLRRLEKEGEQVIRKIEKENPKHIFDTIKSFSLNSLQ
ncbi:hypothetical protein [Fervidibacillus halotolerans]|uniref:Uncharacterized protein n=1 Tax=Fervidibacillus halotolerans TaxID=2980027 RepID=A0A9E8LYV6_9BACI|nr:hypothetical protein [Fervidibacillus halotolerans]WAA12109.1 hypothetical protein OE105_11085 [Fervidibacillus halotolerans]